MKLDNVKETLLEESKRYLPCGHCGNNDSATATFTVEKETKVVTVAWTCSVCGALLYPND